MNRSAAISMAAKLREAAAIVEHKESDILQMERIRAAVAADKSLDFTSGDYVAFFALVSHGGLKPALIEELNKQVAKATADLEAFEFSTKGPT